jgi:hypothetical protein
MNFLVLKKGLTPKEPIKNLPSSDIKLTAEIKPQKSPKKLNSISIKTKGYKFNREEANER